MSHLCKAPAAPLGYIRGMRFSASVILLGLASLVLPDAAAAVRSCDGAGPLPSVAAARATIAQAAWIGGVWIGTAPGLSVEEHWTPAAGGAMLGIGRTLRGAQMSGFEFLCIAEREGSLVYAAMPNGRAPATLFMLTRITDDSATFENPSHDFPKLIRYSRLADGSLQTTISAGADDRGESFLLKRR